MLPSLLVRENVSPATPGEEGVTYLPDKKLPKGVGALNMHDSTREIALPALELGGCLFRCPACSMLRPPERWGGEGGLEGIPERLKAILRL